MANEHQNSKETKVRHRMRSGFAWPFILIIAGIIFLLNNLGYLPWEVWGNIWRLWPLALILIGLEVILGRRAAWWRLFFWVPAVIIVLLFAFLSSSQSPNFIQSLGAQGTPVALEQALGDLEEASVELRLDAGRLEVRALPSDSDQLMAGEFRPRSSSEEIVKEFSLSNGEGKLRLRSRRVGPWSFGSWGSELSIDLSPNIMLDIDVQSDVSRSELDLSRLRLRRLSVTSDVSTSNIVLPQPNGQVSVRIRGDVSRLSLELPSDAAARIEFLGDVNRVDFRESRFVRSEKVYVSENYQGANDRIDIEIRGDVSSITVR